ncbi:hypothetical protein B484DRAFT_479146 [Ochromonadaceae sp. CCMP2298]|nr:hypothetical protein B484DRAFT_479146 [Ochromonadaceae sp. CCMP2298]
MQAVEAALAFTRAGSSVALLARLASILILMSLGSSLVPQHRPSITLLRPSASSISPLARSLQMCSAETEQMQQTGGTQQMQQTQTQQTQLERNPECEQFDLVTSLLLAGYAFEAYNEPPIGKLSLRSDVKTTYTSAEYTGSLFDGVLLLTLSKGSIKYENSAVMERLLTGNDADPYVILSSHHSSGGVRADVDSVRSSTMANSPNPQWSENYSLFIKNPVSASQGGEQGEEEEEQEEEAGAEVDFTVWDRQQFSEDVFIGSASVSLQDIRRASNKVDRTTMQPLALPIPLYRVDPSSSPPQASRANPQRVQRVKRVRVGTLLVSTQYVAFKDGDCFGDSFGDGSSSGSSSSGSSIDSSSSSGSSSGSSGSSDDSSSGGKVSEAGYRLNKALLPGGATPGLSWADLTMKVLDRHRQRVGAEEGAAANAAAANTATTAPTTTSTTAATTTTTATTTAEPSDVSGTSLRLLDSLYRGQLKHVCAIDSLQADTQVMLYADLQSRQLVVSFRGTELGKLQDLLTDINFLQVPLTQSSQSVLKDINVHQGFLSAYRAVQVDLLRQLRQLFRSTEAHEGGSEWDVFLTGHSLGGALAKLFAFDLARIREGLVGDLPDLQVNMAAGTTDVGTQMGMGGMGGVGSMGSVGGERDVNVLAQLFGWAAGTKTSNAYPLDNSPPTALPDAALPFHRDTQFLQALGRCSLHVYTFGAPRVGNTAFRRQFNALVPHCFRVVNRQDVVARMPRSASGLVDYQHCGRTVLIQEGAIPETVNGANGATGAGVRANGAENGADGAEGEVLWIEGASAGECPLQDRAPMTLSQWEIDPASALNAASASALMGLQQALNAASQSAPGGDLDSAVLGALDSLQRLVQASASVTASATAAVAALAAPPLLLSTTQSNSTVTTAPWSPIFDPEALRGAALRGVGAMGASAACWLQGFDGGRLGEVSDALLANISSVRQLVNSTGGQGGQGQGVVVQQSLGLVAEGLAQYQAAMELGRLVDLDAPNQGTGKGGEGKLGKGKGKEGEWVFPALPSLDPLFVERELELLNALMNRTAIEHHLEPSYYAAFVRVIETSTVMG